MGDFAPPDHRKDPVFAIVFWLMIGVVLLATVVSWPFRAFWNLVRS